MMFSKHRSRTAAVLMGVIGVLLAASQPAIADRPATPLRSQMEGAFANLDPGMIATGLLYDRALPLAEIEDFDGSAQAPATVLRHWQQAYLQLRNAFLERPAWPDLLSLDQQVKQHLCEGVIPVAVLDCRYNQIRPDALERGLLGAGEYGLVELGGNPYLARQAFLVSALKGYTHRGGAVTFLFDRALYFSSDDAALPTLTVDFADGRGRRQARFDEPITVVYAAPGTYAVRVEAGHADGSVLESRFLFEVKHLQTPVPDDTLFVTGTIPHESGFASGQAFVYLADSHTSLTNPVVALEGFDFFDDLNWDELYQILNQQDLLETLRGEGFDIVVLNYDQATDYIQRNAFLAVELIEQVNEMLGGPAATDPGTIFLAGASMGGIVGRYALAYMEQNGMNANVRTFLSFDSPQNGANIPLGLQYWVAFFAAESAEAQFFADVLNSPAARQMLTYQYDASPSGSAASDPLRAALDAELALLGDYPQTMRKVAVANGSGSLMDQGYPAGAQVMEYEYSSLLVDIVGNVWSVPDGGAQVIFHGLIDLIWPLPDTEQIEAVSGTRPIDNAPGGLRPSMAEVSAVGVPYGQITSLHDNHCFIPTISALALATDDYFFDIAGEADLLSLTPFDAVYFPVENQEHVAVTPESVVWFLNEVRGGLTPVPSQTPLVPEQVTLRQNQPNPFNPTTSIGYRLSEESSVTLEIFNLKGQKVRTLLRQERRPAGRHGEIWDGRDDRDRLVASGPYFYRIRAGQTFATRRMMLAR